MRVKTISTNLLERISTNDLRLVKPQFVFGFIQKVFVSIIV